MIFYYNYTNKERKDRKFNIEVLIKTKPLCYIIQ